MRGIKFLVLTALVGGALATTTGGAQAQLSINIGPAPACPYGYYDIAPYNCAPAGYYGPEWFNGSVFIGAGPWFHGAREFHGSVNNTYHPDGNANPITDLGPNVNLPLLAPSLGGPPASCSVSYLGPDGY